MSEGTLGLGQIFMRKYGMHITYKKDGTAVYLINQGVDLPSQWIVILIWSIILAVLAIGVVLLAKKKYQRQREQDQVLTTLRRLKLDYDIKIEPDYFYLIDEMHGG